MVDITAEHLHHMAKRHHATMQKLDGIRERYAGVRDRVGGTVETLAGAWLGGTLEGRTAGAALGPLPINLGVGVAMVAASHFDLGGDRWGKHLQQAGDGFIGSWAAATGYAFGKRWKESGKPFGGGGHPWAHPYESGGWSTGVPIGPPPGALTGPPGGPPIGPPPGQ